MAATRNTFSTEEVTTGLMGLVAWQGNAAAAARALRSEGKLEISPTTLANWARETHFERYNELREKYAEKLEADLVNDMRDIARQAMEVQRTALDKSLTRLIGNEDHDPARTASHAARVAQSMTDKMLSLTGRPTSIREDRNLGEIMRSLAAKGVIQLPAEDVTEEPAALEGGD
jgi:uncharacterized membrane protein YccC